MERAWYHRCSGARCCPLRRLCASTDLLNFHDRRNPPFPRGADHLAQATAYPAVCRRHLRGCLRDYPDVHHPAILPIHRVRRISGVGSPPPAFCLPACLQLCYWRVPRIARGILYPVVHTWGILVPCWLRTDVHGQPAHQRQRHLRIQLSDRLGIWNVSPNRTLRGSGQGS